jgi:hypothetical protein
VSNAQFGLLNSVQALAARARALERASFLKSASNKDAEPSHGLRMPTPSRKRAQARKRRGRRELRAASLPLSQRCMLQEQIKGIVIGTFGIFRDLRRVWTSGSTSGFDPVGFRPLSAQLPAPCNSQECKIKYLFRTFDSFHFTTPLLLILLLIVFITSLYIYSPKTENENVWWKKGPQGESGNRALRWSRRIK